MTLENENYNAPQNADHDGFEFILSLTKEERSKLLLMWKELNFNNQVQTPAPQR